jgi:hypothetical protein
MRAEAAYVKLLINGPTPPTVPDILREAATDLGLGARVERAAHAALREERERRAREVAKDDASEEEDKQETTEKTRKEGTEEDNWTARRDAAQGTNENNDCVGHRSISHEEQVAADRAAIERKERPNDDATYRHQRSVLERHALLATGKSTGSGAAEWERRRAPTAERRQRGVSAWGHVAQVLSSGGSALDSDLRIAAARSVRPRKQAILDPLTRMLCGAMAVDSKSRDGVRHPSMEAEIAAMPERTVRNEWKLALERGASQGVDTDKHCSD